MLGKDASDLQDITLSNGVAYGTLKYVEGYTGAFSGDEADGHYIAFKTTAVSGATITVEVLGGLHGASTLDADGLSVCRIMNTNQVVQFKATKNGTTEVYNVSLAGIILE